MQCEKFVPISVSSLSGIRTLCCCVKVMKEGLAKIFWTNVCIVKKGFMGCFWGFYLVLYFFTRCTDRGASQLISEAWHFWDVDIFFCSIPDRFTLTGVPLMTVISTWSFLTQYVVPQVLCLFHFHGFQARLVSAVINHMNLSFDERDWCPPWMFSDQIPGSCTVHWNDRYWIPYFSRSHMSTDGLKM